VHSQRQDRNRSVQLRVTGQGTTDKLPPARAGPWARGAGGRGCGGRASSEGGEDCRGEKRPRKNRLRQSLSQPAGQRAIRILSGGPPRPRTRGLGFLSGTSCTNTGAEGAAGGKLSPRPSPNPWRCAWPSLSPGGRTSALALDGGRGRRRAASAGGSYES